METLGYVIEAVWTLVPLCQMRFPEKGSNAYLEAHQLCHPVSAAHEMFSFVKSILFCLIMGLGEMAYSSGKMMGSGVRILGLKFGCAIYRLQATGLVGLIF